MKETPCIFVGCRGASSNPELNHCNKFNANHCKYKWRESEIWNMISAPAAATATASAPVYQKCTPLFLSHIKHRDPLFFFYQNLRSNLWALACLIPTCDHFFTTSKHQVQLDKSHLIFFRMSEKGIED